MNAARLHRIGSRLSVDRVPVPKLASHDVLIDVRASGICHSDLNYRDGVAPVAKLPITLGHEIAGIVAETGVHVTGVRHGDNVVVHYISSCGRCAYCRTNMENYCPKYRMVGKDIDGGFAEYIRVPARNAVKLPESIPFEQGAIMGCAVSTAYHALTRARVYPKDRVLIIGVGGLGMHAVQLAKNVFSAREVIAVDRFDWKLRQAQLFGATETVNVAKDNAVLWLKRITNGALADVVLDFVGREETIHQGINCLGKGGRLVLVGIGAKSVKLYPYGTIIGKEIEIIGVDDHLRTELIKLIDLVDSGKIDLSHSVTHRITLEDINVGLRILGDRNEKPIRIVVTGTD
jgi:2-desacetyl-2-hydroxyethyl bacteriochlorophyllide A dehydrogenase